MGSCKASRAIRLLVRSSLPNTSQSGTCQLIKHFSLVKLAQPKVAMSQEAPVSFGCPRDIRGTLGHPEDIYRILCAARGRIQLVAKEALTSTRNQDLTSGVQFWSPCRRDLTCFSQSELGYRSQVVCLLRGAKNGVCLLRSVVRKWK